MEKRDRGGCLMFIADLLCHIHGLCSLLLAHLNGQELGVDLFTLVLDALFIVERLKK